MYKREPHTRSVSFYPFDPLTETMNNITFILYLILLANHVRGSSDVEVMHDITDLRDKFDHILGHALLNKNGSDIVKIGRGTYCS